MGWGISLKEINVGGSRIKEWLLGKRLIFSGSRAILGILKVAPSGNAVPHTSRGWKSQDIEVCHRTVGLRRKNKILDIISAGFYLLYVCFARAQFPVTKGLMRKLQASTLKSLWWSWASCCIRQQVFEIQNHNPGTVAICQVNLPFCRLFLYEANRNFKNKFLCLVGSKLCGEGFAPRKFVIIIVKI